MTAFEPNDDHVQTLRTVADEIRECGEGSEAEQLANVLYRTSDLYDEDEDTTPQEIMRNVKFILEVKERDGLER